ncbi:hypothetical protein ACN47E_005199 [Coniothyrium glycines]
MSRPSCILPFSVYARLEYAAKRPKARPLLSHSLAAGLQRHDQHQPMTLCQSPGPPVWWWTAYLLAALRHFFTRVGQGKHTRNRSGREKLMARLCANKYDVYKT